MVIQHNIAALNSHRNLGINNAFTSKNLEKLSSGYRINRAGDDAAGLAISEKMRGQIRGLAMAEQNTQNGVSLIQTAEGGLNETHAILQRMRELAVQSSNGTYQDEDREQITLEFEALKSEITRIADSTHYNGIKLLDGTLGRVDQGANLQGTTTTALGTAFVTAGTATGTKNGAAEAMGATNSFKGDLNFSIDKNGELQVSISGQQLGTKYTQDMAVSAKFENGAVVIDVSGGDGTDKYTTTVSFNMEEDRLRQAIESSDSGTFTFTGEGVAAVPTITAKAGINYSVQSSHSQLAGTTGLSITASTNKAGAEYGPHDIKIEKVRDNSGNIVKGQYLITVGNDQRVVRDSDLANGTGVEIGGFKIEQGANNFSGTLSGKQLFDRAMEKGDIYVNEVRYVDNGAAPGTTNAHLTLDFSKSEIRIGEGVVFQIGANGGQDQRVRLSVENMDAMHIGLKKGDKWADGSAVTKNMYVIDSSVASIKDANKAIEVLDAATNMVSSQRAELGALQNRLEHTLNNLGVTKENLTAAESSIRDVDMAKEMMEFTKNNILVQASQAMLAQANQLPQGVLQLLR